MGTADILRLYGLGLADECVQAAQMEGLDLACAATILQKESGGRNVWGSDGVSTGGLYTKGGPVTQANYLAYRTAMKAGKIGRQGVGPAQCTSAQYQDTADALGGCWDPVANMRSGFRGLGALIRAYGVRDGFRRYNGSGPAAERYADDAVAKCNVWRARLADTPAAPPTPAPAASEDDVSIQNFILSGSGEITPRLPVGNGAIATSRAWISANLRSGATQPGRVRWWFQGETAGIGRRDWTTLTVKDGLSVDCGDEIPAGTRKLNIQYEFPEGGTICLEAIR